MTRNNRTIALPAFLISVTAIVLIAAASIPPAAAQVSVSATCNIYGAGHGSAPGPGGNGGGILPVEVAVPAGTSRTVQFSMSGTVDYGACCPSNGPDGIATGSSAALPLWDGLAGTDMAARGRYFVGVFLDGTEPADPAPARIVFGAGDFTELSPGLRQIFFVGDGLTGVGTGTTQTVNVPDGATRLFLGFQDRGPGPNLPGWYGDNSGSVTGTVTFDVPTGAGTPPATFSLAQNHPNPFNASTTMTFTATESSHFTLEVYDVRGRVVKLLLDETRGTGDHFFVWDGTDVNGRAVSTGVYYYRLSSPASTTVKKMVLLR